MARSVQTQAACLLLLVLVSLASGSMLQHQTGEGELQAADSAEAQTGLTARLHRLWKRDSHFPICMFCCNCCSTNKCGFCCKT